MNGVFLGGGIAPRILPLLRSGGFLEAFRDKGRLGPVLARIPVTVLRDDRAALWGAARWPLERLNAATPAAIRHGRRVSSPAGRASAAARRYFAARSRCSSASSSSFSAAGSRAPNFS